MSISGETACIAVCPKCKAFSLEERQVCEQCGSPVIETALPIELYRSWVKDEKKHGYLKSMAFSELCESYTAPLEKLEAGLRDNNLKAAKRAKYIRMLWLRRERDRYIPEIIGLLADPNLSGIAGYYLYVCAQFQGNGVYRHLKLEHLANLKCKSMFLPAIPADYVQELKLPILLRKYARREACACENCGKPTVNISIKIMPQKNLVNTIRKGSYVYSDYSYFGKADTHVICNDCILDKVKRKRSKDKSDAQLIDEYLRTNSVFSLSVTGLAGYNYEDLTDPQHLPEYTPTMDFPIEAFHGMCRYAQELKAMIEALK
ncbi:MAG: hypothetical protein Q4C01_03310 [Clostridia bacterium]|nr:hypothetical protein [Clostridia bacterium]